MRILFLVYHGFSPYSGISKKIHYQVKGLKENGHDVRLCYYDFAGNGHSCRFVDNLIIKDYGKGKWAGFRQRMDYGCILDYCIREKIGFIYARCFQNANPFLIRFFKKIRMMGIHVVTEIPTYPYDAEFIGFPFLARMNLKIDQLFRHQLAAQMDAIVTFSDAEIIFGQRTIRISNGVDFESIPLHQLSVIGHQPSAIHLVGVAEIHYWHGFDRLIAGIGEYYINGGNREVFFHIVGGVAPSEMYGSVHAPGFEELMKKYHIKDRIVFHGQLFGDALTEVFNQCQFAIGSLARHRSGITTIKTLKNREYAARGIPFIYSEQDSDFDQQLYVLKAPADESPIDIRKILDFVDENQMKPDDIRKTIGALAWNNQMQKVLDAVKL